MNKERYKVAEAANLAGLSKPTAYKYLQHFNSHFNSKTEQIDDVTYLSDEGLQLLLHINDLRKNKGLSLGEITEILSDSNHNGNNRSKEGVNDSVKILQKENELLKQENEFLKIRLTQSEEHNEQLTKELSESNLRHDTIVLQFTRQFEQQKQVLEDLREQNNKKKWWKWWKE